MLETIDKKGLGVQEANIRWVLTVPAIWTDAAKQFMIAAAEGVSLNKRPLDEDSNALIHHTKLTRGPRALMVT